MRRTTTVALGLACLLGAALQPLGLGTVAAAASPHASKPVCGPAHGSVRRCNARLVVDSSGHPLNFGTGATPNAITPNVPSPPYTPADIEGAYGLPTASGVGYTVAIVDAYGDTNAVSLFSQYRSDHALPACTTGSGCLRVLNQTGGTGLPAQPSFSDPNFGWVGETDLDLDAVSASCPNCHIILLEATTANDSDLMAAVNTAVTLGAQVVSMSWGGPEDQQGDAADDPSFNRAGVAMVASSGDSGFGPQFPAASPFVTSVGGTSLNYNGSYQSETVWNGTGSGCSQYENKPSWQVDSGCSHRTLNDVSADADPNTGLLIYTTDTNGSTIAAEAGGTSLSAPLIAGVYALSGGEGSGTTGGRPWYEPTPLHDVTSGNNGACSPGYLCSAVTGYDGPTGNGTPNGAMLPRIEDVSPLDAVAGTTVTISGARFDFANADTTVSFGGNAGTSVNVVDQHTITAVVPSGTGSVDVSVTTPAGTSVAHPGAVFRYSGSSAAGSFPTFSAVSRAQYKIVNSDGASWLNMDSNKLSLTVTPTSNVSAVLSGNSDLWTATAGFNQDIGISISGGAYPSSAGQPEAWKESGGFAGTFSPNAAFVQTVVPLNSGVTYTIRLVWKANKGGASTIAAGAGPINGLFSPTRLTAVLYPSSGTTQTKLSTQQYILHNSDGTTWQNMDGSGGLTMVVTPSSTSTVVLSANSDLWTATAGFNQDIAISVNGTVLAWKESGGFGGTYSPNAAFVQATTSMTASTAYTVTVQWKTNKSGTSTIAAGAGPISSKFSPTRLTAVLLPSTPVADAHSTLQYHLSGSDGATWQTMDGTNLVASLHPTTDCTATLSANADLWTAQAGYNQDIAISVNGVVVAWKESGGFAGTYSPNAAFVERAIALHGGSSYTVSLVWKTNKPDPGTIAAGAGPISSAFSPTRLVVQLGDCN